MAHMIGGYFGFAISDSGSDQATGVFLTYGIYGETVVRRRTLSSSAAAYNKLVQDLDAMQAGYWKDTTGCVDGAPIAFERVSGTVVRSGIGNCSDHYEKVGMRIYEFLASETNQKELFGPDGWRLR
jgi:hypothetical protein